MEPALSRGACRSHQYNKCEIKTNFFGTVFGISIKLGVLEFIAARNQKKCTCI